MERGVDADGRGGFLSWGLGSPATLGHARTPPQAFLFPELCSIRKWTFVLSAGGCPLYFFDNILGYTKSQRRSCEPRRWEDGVWDEDGGDPPASLPARSFLSCFCQKRSHFNLADHLLPPLTIIFVCGICFLRYGNDSGSSLLWLRSGIGLVKEMGFRRRGNALFAQSL